MPGRNFLYYLVRKWILEGSKEAKDKYFTHIESKNILRFKQYNPKNDTYTFINESRQNTLETLTCEEVHCLREAGQSDLKKLKRIHKKLS